MAPSSPEESELYSLFTDLFPAPQKRGLSSMFGKPQDIWHECISAIDSFLKPQRPINTPTERERQDALVKKFPGTKIVCRAKEEVVPPNEFVNQFPRRDCEKRLETLYEKMRLLGKENYNVRLCQSNILQCCGIVYLEDEK